MDQNFELTVSFIQHFLIWYLFSYWICKSHLRFLISIECFMQTHLYKLCSFRYLYLLPPEIVKDMTLALHLPVDLFDCHLFNFHTCSRSVLCLQNQLFTDQFPFSHFVHDFLTMVSIRWFSRFIAKFHHEYCRRFQVHPLTLCDSGWFASTIHLLCLLDYCRCCHYF